MIVIDTDILIDAGRGVEQALNALRKYERGIIAISVITETGAAACSGMVRTTSR